MTKKRSAIFGGWSLDALDVQMYRIVIPIVIGIWGCHAAKPG